MDIVKGDRATYIMVTYMYALMHTHTYIHYYRLEDGHERGRGVKSGDVLISYKMIFQDVRTSVDWVHNQVNCYALAFANSACKCTTNYVLPIFSRNIFRGQNFCRLEII